MGNRKTLPPSCNSYVTEQGCRKDGVTKGCLAAHKFMMDREQVSQKLYHQKLTEENDRETTAFEQMFLK